MPLFLVCLVACLCVLFGFPAGQAAEVCLLECRLLGDWEITVSGQGGDGKAFGCRFTVAPVETVTVQDERCQNLPAFNPKGWNWGKGYTLRGVRAQECTSGGALIPGSVSVIVEETQAELVRGVDYELDDLWGAIGRLPDGNLQERQPVLIRYAYAPQRIDSVVLGGNGVSYKQGTPRVSEPVIPGAGEGEALLANIFLEGNVSQLAEQNLFPVFDPRLPAELVQKEPAYAEQRLPRTLKKLRAGERLKILAWGDSVTHGGYLPNPDQDRWQSQFVARLTKRYPQAQIELVTEAWPSHNTDHYLSEPAGSVHGYAEKVLGTRPDLVVTEFINDQWFPSEKTMERYGRLLLDFREIGAEWIICTPHYPYPKSIRLPGQRDIDNDPRPYVSALREFASSSDVALADVARRYGHLWREGMPYMTLMQNGFNHPSPYGMQLYAETLICLFPER